MDLNDALSAFELHSGEFEYDLAAYLSATENGALAAAERRLATAAQHAAILTELRAIIAQGQQQ